MSITYTVLDKPSKLNFGFFNLLPKFHELAGEDPYRHISEFLITCSAMVPERIPEDQIRLRAFPFLCLVMLRTGYIICLLDLFLHGLHCINRF